MTKNEDGYNHVKSIREEKAKWPEIARQENLYKKLETEFKESNIALDADDCFYNFERMIEFELVDDFDDDMSWDDINNAVLRRIEEIFSNGTAIKGYAVKYRDFRKGILS